MTLETSLTCWENEWRFSEKRRPPCSQLCWGGVFPATGSGLGLKWALQPLRGVVTPTRAVWSLFPWGRAHGVSVIDVPETLLSAAAAVGRCIGQGGCIAQLSDIPS